MPREMKSVNITQAMIDPATLIQTQGGDITANVEMMAALDRLFNEVRAAVVDATQKRRMARAAVMEAEMANANRERLLAQFLHFVGEHCPDVANWDFWPLPPKKDDNGDIILETPLSEDEVRTSARVMHKVMTTQQDAVLKRDRDQDGDDYSGMFGSD